MFLSVFVELGLLALILICLKEKLVNCIFTVLPLNRIICETLSFSTNTVSVMLRCSNVLYLIQERSLNQWRQFSLKVKNLKNYFKITLNVLPSQPENHSFSGVNILEVVISKEAFSLAGDKIDFSPDLNSMLKQHSENKTKKEMHFTSRNKIFRVQHLKQSWNNSSTDVCVLDVWRCTGDQFSRGLCALKGLPLAVVDLIIQHKIFSKPFCGRTLFIQRPILYSYLS